MEADDDPSPDDAAPSAAGPHGHRDCPPRDRIWLPRDPSGSATVALHPYCVGCGTVRDLGLPRPKPLGFYLAALANLKQHLASSDRGAVARVHTHLIAERLRERSEFEDAYGTPGAAQREAYVEVVQSVLPHVEAELVLRCLPTRGRGPREGSPTSP